MTLLPSTPRAAATALDTCDSFNAESSSSAAAAAVPSCCTVICAATSVAPASTDMRDALVPSCVASSVVLMEGGEVSVKLSRGVDATNRMRRSVGLVRRRERSIGIVASVITVQPITPAQS